MNRIVAPPPSKQRGDRFPAVPRSIEERSIPAAILRAESHNPSLLLRAGARPACWQDAYG